MSLERDLKALKDKYKAERKWVQGTKDYGWYVYPHNYYKELIETVLAYR